MSKNLGLALVLIAAVILMVAGLANSYLEYFQAWLAAEHPVSGLVLVLGAIVIVIGTKILWR